MTKPRISINLIIQSFIVLILFSCTEEKYDLDSGEVIGNILPEETIIIFDRGDKQFSTVSNADGQFMLSDIETGIYNITFKKEGYISFKKFGFQFVPGPSLVFVKTPGNLVLMPKNTVQIKSVEDDGNQYIKVMGTYVNNDQLPDIRNKVYRWYIHITTEVSSENYLQTKTSTIYISDQEYYTWIGLDKKHIENGSTVYIIGYEEASWYNYYDWDKNQQIYAISEDASNTYSFVLPTDFFEN